MAISASTQHLMACVRQLVKPALYIAVIKGFFGLGVALSSPLQIVGQTPNVQLDIVKVKLVRMPAEALPAKATNLTVGALEQPPLLPYRPKPDWPSPVKPVPAVRHPKPAGGMCPVLVAAGSRVTSCRGPIGSL